jgi:hypothetical protein
MATARIHFTPLSRNTGSLSDTDHLPIASHSGGQVRANHVRSPQGTSTGIFTGTASGRQGRPRAADHNGAWWASRVSLDLIAPFFRSECWGGRRTSYPPSTPLTPVGASA